MAVVGFFPLFKCFQGGLPRPFFTRPPEADFLAAFVLACCGGGGTGRTLTIADEVALESAKVDWLSSLFADKIGIDIIGTVVAEDDIVADVFADI